MRDLTSTRSRDIFNNISVSQEEEKKITWERFTRLRESRIKNERAYDGGVSVRAAKLKVAVSVIRCFILTFP